MFDILLNHFTLAFKCFHHIKSKWTNHEQLSYLKINLIESFIFASIQMPFVLTYGLLFMFWGIRWQGQKSNFSYHFEVIIPLPKKKKKNWSDHIIEKLKSWLYCFCRSANTTQFIIGRWGKGELLAWKYWGFALCTEVCPFSIEFSLNLII